MKGTEDCIISEQVDYLEEQLKNLRLFAKDVEELRKISDKFNGVMSWFMHDGVEITFAVQEKLKEVGPFIREIKKTGKYKSIGKCDQPTSNSVWFSYKHKPSGIVVILCAVLTGSKCVFVEDRVETKIVYKVTCN